jgi:hypothetical protein
MIKNIGLIIIVLLVAQSNQYKNCHKDPNAIGNAKGGPGCVCADGFVFKSSAPNDVWCERDCQNVANSNGLADLSNFAQCQCDSGFVWSSTDLICERDCTNDANSKQTYNTDNVAQCQCLDGFSWDDTVAKCVRDCSNDANSQLTFN